MALPVDDVVLKLGTDSVRIAESYEIKAGVLTQPAAFSLRLGHGGTAEELIRSYPDGSPFTLSINGKLQQTGTTDGITSGEGSGATEITFDGRDRLSRVVDAYVQAETSFSGLTYAELNRQVLELCGLRDFQIHADNDANRRRMTGKETVNVNPPTVDGQLFSTSGEVVRLETIQSTRNVIEDTEGVIFRNPVPGTVRTSFKTIKINVGTRWYDWLKAQNDRAGFFLWARADGDFNLTTPVGTQAPTYELTRPRRGERGAGKVLRHSFRRNIGDRYTKWIAYGKGGGRNLGRGSVRGTFVDLEMSRLLGGEDAKIRTEHDDKSKTPQQAEYFARRQCAEANRNGWNLTYTVAGHSMGGAVWVPDTVVAVNDQEIGIRGNFYLESVTMNRAPTTTTLRLMRPEDLVFALDAEGPT